jgi:membrane-bound lytic murein transglycosylase A
MRRLAASLLLPKGQHGRAFSAAVLAFAVAVGLVGCDDQSGQAAKKADPAPPPALPVGMSLSPAAFAALPGWNEDSILQALPALRRTCAVLLKRKDSASWMGPGEVAGTVADWQQWCDDLNRALPDNQPPSPTDSLTLRAVIESRLQPYAVTYSGSDGAVTATGTFTGYYEASLKGSLTRQPGYEVPLYGPPDDLVTLDLGQAYADLKGQKVVGRVVGHQLLPYWTRAEIDGGAIEKTLGPTKTPVVAWAADAVDAHILHIQGSGVLDLPDGGTAQVGYAGNNGHRFVGIGRVMLDRGLVGSGGASMPAIRAWLKDHPEQADSVLQANPRYIFFRTLKGPGPLGSMGVALTPGRSMAIDTRYVTLGTPLWLDSVDPDGEPLQRLMVAQDTGSAIKGVVRGDFYWGAGEPALAKAGRMKSSGTYYLLLPRARTSAATP